MIPFISSSLQTVLRSLLLSLSSKLKAKREKVDKRSERLRLLLNVTQYTPQTCCCCAAAAVVAVIVVAAAVALITDPPVAVAGVAAETV